MKYTCPIVLVILLASTDGFAQDNPCESVTCSSAGVCAISETGGPTCVCNDGYQPDATGLECVAAVAATPAPAEATPPPPTCATAEMVLLQVNRGRAIKQLVVWPIFFVLGTGVLIGGAVLFDKNSKLWPLHLAMMVTGGFIAAASALIIGIYAGRVARINKRLKQCRGLACIDFTEDTALALHPTGLTLSF